MLDYVYIWRWLCVSFPFKLYPQYKCVLNIVNSICYLNIHSSGLEIPDRRKRCKLDFKGFGVSHKNKTREEDGSDVRRKDNNIDRESRCAKGALWNDVNSGGYNGIDRVQASLRNKSSVWLEYIKLKTQLNQFEMFEEHWKVSILEGKQRCFEWKQCWSKTVYK